MGVVINPGPGMGTRGTATMSSGSVTIPLSSISTGDQIYLTPKGGGILSNLGIMRVSINAGVGFTVTSSNILDNNSFDWIVVPAGS
jgi:hypothetical protein